jgi:hypothetical protein
MNGVDVFFRLLAPKTHCGACSYPGTVRGLFASPGYLKVAGIIDPGGPHAHKCVGSGPWKLSRGKRW